MTWDDCVEPHCQKDPDHVTHPLHIEIMEQDLSRLIPEGCGHAAAEFDQMILKYFKYQKMQTDY